MVLASSRASTDGAFQCLTCAMESMTAEMDQTRVTGMHDAPVCLYLQNIHDCTHELLLLLLLLLFTAVTQDNLS